LGSDPSFSSLPSSWPSTVGATGGTNANRGGGMTTSLSSSQQPGTPRLPPPRLSLPAWRRNQLPPPSPALPPFAQQWPMPMGWANGPPRHGYPNHPGGYQFPPPEMPGFGFYPGPPLEPR
jgi:hypothetical protein